jgi:ankyrin repeat protein
MIQPKELASELPYGPWSCRGSDIWKAFTAAAAGNAGALRRLLLGDPNLYRAEYWYTQPIHFAVRGGHLKAVRVLLEAGADPALVGLLGEDLLTAARDRGHEAVARLLEETCDARRRSRQPERPDHPFYAAVQAGNLKRVRKILDAEPGLVFRANRAGSTALHIAVGLVHLEMIDLLIERGADMHALHGPGPASERGYAPVDFQPIDLALWSGPHWRVVGNFELARFLLQRGAAYDLTIAAALGDHEAVLTFLEKDPKAITGARPCGKRALSSAIELGHESIVRLLLDHGVNPNWPEGSTAPRGLALHRAASSGNRYLIELLLLHGADPNATLDSSGSATYIAKTPGLRELLVEHGGKLDAYDMVWLGDDAEAVRIVAADPSAADAGCGGVFAAACVQGKRSLVVRLLEAGARVPPVVTGCRSYLLSEPDLLRLLLESGMNPDLPNWQHATPLHDLCGRDSRGRPRPHRTECAGILLDAGASINARDEEYRSTPLAWAARNDLPDMVDLLLSRGAPAELPDDEPWATPLAWATRRGHERIVELLRRVGVTA